VVPGEAGALSLSVPVPRPGRYRLWVGGSTRGELRGSIDGTAVGHVSDQLQNGGQWLDLGARRLSRGAHTVRLAVSLGPLKPGTRGASFSLGPVLLQPVVPEPSLRARNPHALCGRRLDWVEATRASTAARS
jgi:hypothetical protein